MERGHINIYFYSDFRIYLRDYYRSRKSRDRKFSHRFIQDKVGANSAGWFADIISGRIALTSSFRVRLARLLELQPKEEDPSAYFQGRSQPSGGNDDVRKHRLLRLWKNLGRLRR
jgi:uncharacterized protein (TIGR02147 family)